MYEAKIICDSIANDNRLTTMQITHPRVIHSEFLTHRQFCRCASSSRAVPFKKMLQQVLNDPFTPVHYGKNKPGMSADEEINSLDKETAKYFWLRARDKAVTQAERLHELGLHKQICNRLLEPFSWITVCVTGDQSAWSNYFALRCHKDAMPEIQKQAYLARDCYIESTPEILNPGEWHLPYLRQGEIIDCDDPETINWKDIKIKISVGRCARVSYLTQEGIRNPWKDVELHDRLVTSKPMHASPLEHVQMASRRNWNFSLYRGWQSYRHMLKDEYVTDYFKRTENEGI